MSKRLIYAEDAIDALAKGNWGVEWDKALAEAIIKNVPSAQPEPLKIHLDHELTEEECQKMMRIGGSPVMVLPQDRPQRIKGRWIEVTNGRGGHECNQCHDYAPSWPTGEERLTNYCPNCGADMRQGEQE